MADWIFQSPAATSSISESQSGFICSIPGELRGNAFSIVNRLSGREVGKAVDILPYRLCFRR